MSTSSSTPVRQELERDDTEECLATFWQQATPGTTYYRCLLPARHLPGQCLKLEAEDLDWDEGADRLHMPRQRGAAVWQFLGDPWRSKVAWGQQDHFGIRVLMEVDDNYTVPNPVAPNQRSSWHRTKEESLRPGATGYSYEMHREILPTFDGIIASTPYLQRVYEDFNDHVYLCRNQIDPVDWELDFEPKDPDVLRIVYSGSPSHWKDAPQLTKAFKWASRQPGVEVWVQGFCPAGWTFAKVVPWTQSIEEYRQRLGSFDVGVAPLAPGRWANGKSDLKFLEYGMASVMPLVGVAEPYSDINELFPELSVVGDERAWMDALKRVVKQRDEVKANVARVRDYVQAERTIEKNITPWREAILDGPS